MKTDITRQQLLDLYFVDARSKLIDIAAFLDRLERAPGPSDFREPAFRAAIAELSANTDRARRVLLSLSDTTSEPVAAASIKGAAGAYNP